MIPKLTTGNGFGGSLRYDTRQGQGTKPGLAKVLDVSGVEFDIDKDGNYVINTRQVSRDFRAQTMGYQGKRDIRKPVYHWVLSYHPEDKVSEEQMIEDAKDFLKRIGFDDTQYVMTVHYDKDHHHLHIVTNVVNNQGKRIPTMGLIDKAHKAAAAITRERHYIWGEKTQKQDITQEKIHDPHDRARKIIEPIIQEAKEKATSLDEFKEILETHGISCKITLAQDGKRGGISYAYEYEGMVHPFKGSSIGRELSFGYVKEAVDANIKKAQTETVEQDAAQAQIYRNIWYTSLAPQYTQAVSVCNRLYTEHRKIWDAVAADSRELSDKFSQVQDLKVHSDQLQDNIRNAQTSAAVLTAISIAICFMNPLAAIAVKVIGKIVIDANKEMNIARRRAIRKEMSGLFEDISAIKEHQAGLKAEDRVVMRDYTENKAEKDAFKEAYEAVKTHQAIPVLAEKFENISRFFPDAQEVEEGNIKKSKAGYDLFFVQVDGQKHVAADLNGKVVISKETIEGSFNLSSLHWKDDTGKEYTFSNGQLQEEISELDLIAALGGTSTADQSSITQKKEILSAEDCRYIAEALRGRTMQEARLDLGRKGFNVFAVQGMGGISDLRIVKNGETFYAHENFSTQELSSSLENFARLSGTQTTATIERERNLKAQQEARARRAAEERQNRMNRQSEEPEETNGWKMRL